MVRLRGTLPRTRYDQFMRFGWKFLIPTTIVWVVAVAFLQAANNGFLGDKAVTIFGAERRIASLIVIGVLALLVLAATWVWEGKQAKKAEAAKARIGKSLARSVDKGRLTAEAAAQTLERITPAGSYDAFADVDLAVEAVAEDLEVKRQLFQALDKV